MNHNYASPSLSGFECMACDLLPLNSYQVVKYLTNSRPTRNICWMVVGWRNKTSAFFIETYYLAEEIIHTHVIWRWTRKHLNNVIYNFTFFKVCNSFSHMYDLGKSVSQFPVTDVDIYVHRGKWIELDQSAQI